MDGLLLWLLFLGVIAVAAVYLYNRREEARFRKESETAFGGQDGDALMDSDAPRGTPGARIEPQLQGDAAAQPSGPDHRREPRAMAERAEGVIRAEPAPAPISAAMAKAQAHSAAQEQVRAPSTMPEPARMSSSVASGSVPGGSARGGSAPGRSVPGRSVPGGPAPGGAVPAGQDRGGAAPIAPTVAAQPASPAAPRSPAPPGPPPEVAPDPIAYCAELYAPEAVPSSALEQLLRAVGPLSPRVRLEGRNVATQAWTAMERSTYGTFQHMRACLQLVDRRGMVGQQDVIVFQSAVARCAASIPASANIPEAEPSLARARELDGFCAEVDVVVGINLVASRGQPFLGTRLRGLAEAAGFRLAEGAFAYPDAQGGVRFTLENQEPTRLLGEALRSLQTAGVTLLLDVPRLADGVAAFDEMVTIGRQLAQSLGGTLVDDNHVPVTETGLEQIRNQLRGIYASMQAQGIPAGSQLALRLFS